MIVCNCVLPQMTGRLCHRCEAARQELMRHSRMVWSDSSSETHRFPPYPTTIDWYFRDLLEPEATRPEDV